MIALTLALELGLLPAGALQQWQVPQVDSVAGWTYAELSARGAVGPVFLEGRLRNTQSKRDSGDLAFDSDGVWYAVGAGVELGPLTVGWRHSCAHPVAEWQPQRGGAPIWDAWYEEVYGRITLNWRSAR